MNTSLISIVVPIYNVERELDRCMRSLLQQTYTNIEIIMVDDGSPDLCPQMCDDYAKLDSRVKVIHKCNGGLSDSRNVGLRYATGEFIMYIDSDDYIELDSCERLINEVRPDVDFVVGVIKEVREQQISYQRRSTIKVGKVYNSKEFIIESIKANEFYAPAVMNLYRREFLINNNLFFKEGILFEDHQMLPRLYLAAKKIVYIDYAFYNYIIRSGSIMTSGASEEKVKMSLDIYREWFENIHYINDKSLQKYMYGILIRYYLSNARVRKIKGWNIEGFNVVFLLRNALNFKEMIKIMAFTLFPNFYLNYK